MSVEVGRTLAFFFEREFTLLVVVLVLSSTSILPTLYIKNFRLADYRFHREGFRLSKVADSGARGCRVSYFSLILRHNDYVLLVFASIAVCRFESW